MTPRPPPSATLDFLHASWRSLRPEQWTKNLVVMAPFFFALGDQTQVVAPGLLLRAALATVLFCLVSSGVYLFNDLMDLDADRRHPTKSRRPLAAGEFPLRTAWSLAAVLMLAGLGIGWLLSLPLAFCLALYLALQFTYTLWLKHIPLLDILMIAAGFVLRALAGAATVVIPISPWLVVCTFLLAMFLGLCKRRQEKAQLEEAGTSAEVRPSLAGYHRNLLDGLVLVVAGTVMLAYAGYAVAPETVRKFGGYRLLATLPFVIFGVLRYLVLVFRRNLGDRPERILLTDVPMVLNLAFYGAVVLWLAF